MRSHLVTIPEQKRLDPTIGASLGQPADETRHASVEGGIRAVRRAEFDDFTWSGLKKVTRKKHQAAAKSKEGMAEFRKQDRVGPFCAFAALRDALLIRADSL